MTSSELLEEVDETNRGFANIAQNPSPKNPNNKNSTFQNPDNINQQFAIYAAEKVIHNSLLFTFFLPSSKNWSLLIWRMHGLLCSGKSQFMIHQRLHLPIWTSTPAVSKPSVSNKNSGDCFISLTLRGSKCYQLPTYARRASRSILTQTHQTAQKQVPTSDSTDPWITC